MMRVLLTTKKSGNPIGNFNVLNYRNQKILIHGTQKNLKIALDDNDMLL